MPSILPANGHEFVVALVAAGLSEDDMALAVRNPEIALHIAGELRDLRHVASSELPYRRSLMLKKLALPIGVEPARNGHAPIPGDISIAEAFSSNQPLGRHNAQTYRLVRSICRKYAVIDHSTDPAAIVPHPIVFLSELAAIPIEHLSRVAYAGPKVTDLIQNVLDRYPHLRPDRAQTEP